MPTIWTFVRAAAVLVGSSAALLTGGIAHADPAPAPAPAPNIPQQLISSAANAPQILQNLATALGATPPLSAPKVAEPAPGGPLSSTSGISMDGRQRPARKLSPRVQKTIVIATGMQTQVNVLSRCSNQVDGGHRQPHRRFPNSDGGHLRRTR